MGQRINKAIELLEQGQPVYYVGTHHDGDVSYEAGRRLARTWADFINVTMEHNPFDMSGLHAFMRGLVDGGPTASGHRTPAVIVELPLDGASAAGVRANAWQMRQALAQGVHGVLLCHAEQPEAVRAFVEACRFPHASTGVGEALGQGTRGSGGQARAGEVWGISAQEYLERADPWPLNPQGELLLGIKLENSRALANAEASAQVPGIAFAEWGPGDMGMSMGFGDRHDPPYPPEMLAAQERIMKACASAGLHFLNMVFPEDVTELIDKGVRICSVNRGDGERAAEIGRRHTGRTMPV